MNADFDISEVLERHHRNFGRTLHFDELIKLMKSESSNKDTILAMGDKILLHRLIENLGVPQMPLLLAVHSNVSEKQVDELVARVSMKGDEEAFTIVAKPTHLSNGDGVRIFSKKKWEEKGWSSKRLHGHILECLSRRADASESEALKSLTPGFVVQPRYRSIIDFGLPLELRVITVWGKARFGVWWWGRSTDFQPGDGGKPQRTTWFARRLCGHDPGPEDAWEMLHGHAGANRGFSAAVELFRRELPKVAAAAEAIAVVLGAPFLRCDFFVGSGRWGVRLNEVAYGSGCDLLRNGPHGTIEDDCPVVARILQAGMQRCQQRPPEYFLAPLGAEGTYHSNSWWASLRPSQEPCMRITPQASPRLPMCSISSGSQCQAVPFSDCQTTKHSGATHPFSMAFGHLTTVAPQLVRAAGA